MVKTMKEKTVQNKCRPPSAAKHGREQAPVIVAIEYLEVSRGMRNTFAAGLYARTLALNQQMVEAAALRELRA